MNPVLAQVLIQGGFAAILGLGLWGGYHLAKPFLTSLVAELNANTKALLAVAGKVESFDQKLDAKTDAIDKKVDSSFTLLGQQIGSMKDALISKIAGTEAAVSNKVENQATHIAEVVRDRNSIATQKIIDEINGKRRQTGEHPALEDERDAQLPPPPTRTPPPARQPSRQR